MADHKMRSRWGRREPSRAGCGCIAQVRGCTSAALAALVALTLLSACATHLGRPEGGAAPAAVRTGFNVERDRVYSPPGWPETLRADLYRPQADAPRPAVLLIHGGGWSPPDRRSQMDSIAGRLAARGYVVMNATYRLAPQHQHPAPVEDLREALAWLRAHADELGARADRVATFGYSAGGHLAALLGTLDAPPGQRVQAVVAGGAPT
ncbi:MAG: alpha/beta hydrolase, partial [Rhodocyclaceae bacterium]|nr:alpha/beta hydrolase [Rhodocyclaceae bacterium]